jgi:hypothetical protein
MNTCLRLFCDVWFPCAHLAPKFPPAILPPTTTLPLSSSSLSSANPIPLCVSYLCVHFTSYEHLSASICLRLFCVLRVVYAPFLRAACLFCVLRAFSAPAREKSHAKPGRHFCLRPFCKATCPTPELRYMSPLMTPPRLMPW